MDLTKFSKGLFWGLIFIYALRFVFAHFFYSQVVDGKQIAAEFPIPNDYIFSLQNKPLLQLAINPEQKSFRFEKYTLTPQASFQLQARVLSKHRYYTSEKTDTGLMDPRLFPMDLAVGWRVMSDPHIISQMRISQSGRFAFWEMDHYVIPLRDISVNVTNMHIIPGSKEVFYTLKAVTVGDVLSLSGYLVNVKDQNGQYWDTSLSLFDTGPGACKVFLVEKVLKN